MALDPTTLLNKIEAAITALVEGGASSYSIGNRSVTKLDLDDLFAQRASLLNEINRNSGGSIRLAKLRRAGR